eukprot:2117845-Alexandrium_andersonii.AAC.1
MRFRARVPCAGLVCLRWHDCAHCFSALPLFVSCFRALLRPACANRFVHVRVACAIVGCFRTQLPQLPSSAAAGAMGGVAAQAQLAGVLVGSTSLRLLSTNKLA